MKPALLVLGGITYKNYAVGDLLSMPEAKNYNNGNGNSLARYSYIKELDCEQFLDDQITNWFEMIPILGLPFQLWDRFGDYFKIIGSKKIMQTVSEYVYHEAELANKLYGKVDLIAHSLGTLIALSSDIKVKNLYLLGSPLTSKYWTVKKTANDFIQNKGIKIKAKNMIYCWSKNDIVCTSRIPDTLNKFCEFENVNSTPSTHNFKNYLQLLLNEVIDL